ncbi:MAG: zinc ribbon domain-containing protein [Longimicrobiales bacterium]
MGEVHQALITLQDLDREIHGAQQRLAAFTPQMEEVEAPLKLLESELEAVRNQLETARKEARRLERSADENRQRVERYEERLMRVRDMRGEAAARTELDLIQRALEADEQDAINMLDQVRRAELKGDDLAKKIDELRSEVDPRLREILEQRAVIEAELSDLLGRRQEQTGALDAPVRQMYERARGGRARMVLAALTLDGACGHCFSMVPIQRQAEIRDSGALVRCEECGVILYHEES